MRWMQAMHGRMRENVQLMGDSGPKVDDQPDNPGLQATAEEARDVGVESSAAAPEPSC